MQFKHCLILRRRSLLRFPPKAADNSPTAAGTHSGLSCLASQVSQVVRHNTHLWRRRMAQPTRSVSITMLPLPHAQSRTVAGGLSWLDGSMICCDIAGTATTFPKWLRTAQLREQRGLRLLRRLAPGDGTPNAGLLCLSTLLRSALRSCAGLWARPPMRKHGLRQHIATRIAPRRLTCHTATVFRAPQWVGISEVAIFLCCI